VTTLGERLRRALHAILRNYVQHRPVEIDRRLESLRVIAERARPDLFAATDLTRFEYKVFSQNGEDGVVVEVLNRIGAVGHYFVEFGVQSGHEGNCVLLADLFGWRGLFIEADDAACRQLQAKYANSDVTVRHAKVTADRVEAIFAEAGVPVEPDVLSIDIDGNDLYVWTAITGYRPRLVIIEYNAGLDVREPRVQPPDEQRGWDGTGAYGSSLAALDTVAERKGYRRIHTELAGVNAFYLRADLLPLVGVDRTPRRNANFGLTGGRHVPATPRGGWVAVPDPSAR
jgi:hypothetical protein